MVRENIIKVRQSIAESSRAKGVNPDKITIVAVSKGRSIDEIKEAVEAGITDIGENKVQEALIKHDQLRTISSLSAIKWHMVGHLQTNKVKDAVRIFDLIHSIDSLHLAQEIDKQAAIMNKIQDVLIEIKTSEEPSKFGLQPETAIEVIKEIKKLKNLNLKGLMTIAPLADDPEKARPYFRRLRELRDKIDGLQLLSMGMTDDFRVAVEEGSNMVRLGRAIFEG